MDRRRFLETLAFSAAAPFALTAARADEAYSGYRHALREHPWLAAFRGLDADVEAPALRIEGRIPRGLRGTLFRNGPAMLERSGARYGHLFDGDGMVQAFRIDASGVSHRGRFVRTAKFALESEHGRFILPGFGTPRGKDGFAANGRPDASNVANTNVVPHAGRLLALWEGGSAYELDPATLATRGPVSWREDLRSVPFSAHPKVEPDATMWNMGAAPNALVLYRIDAGGSLAQAHVVPVPGLLMNHDFAVSERHLVFVLPATRFDPEKLRSGMSFVDSLSFPADAAMRVLVVEKADLARQRWYELPPGFVFHFGNAWDDGGTLRFDYVHHADASILQEALGGMMRGDPAAFRDRPARSTHVAIDLARGTVRTDAWKDTVEFPRVDARRVGRRNRDVWHAASGATGVGTLHLDAIVRYDLEGGARDLFRYGPGTVVEEHIHVPDPASTREGTGWLVGCAFDVATQRTSLNIFEATRLAAGPLARAWLPYGLPLGFHGNWSAVTS